MSDTAPLLSVRDLRVQFNTDEGVVRAVDGISFDVAPGETVCVVGESGSGKTVACESITKLIPMPPGEIAGGEVRFDGDDLTDASEKQLQSIRGDRIAHIFQDPQGALNPVYPVGAQIAEAVRLHSDVSKAAARDRAIDLLDRVGIPEATNRVDDYPHEFSGGMKQRVVIAMALAADPDLLIADEPTTALDVTIQSQILNLLRDLQDEFGMSIIFVTHNLGVVAEVADRVVVMYAGKVMETGSVHDVFERPSHPYTKSLLECLPGIGRSMEPIGGSLPDLTAPPEGCRFHPRCPHATADCRSGSHPELLEAASDHRAACVYYGPGYDVSAIRGDGEAETRATDGGRDDSHDSHGDSR
ncbi:dipeptide/oligopeptide/nickel ABC transporter ATP-binding protein [Haloferax mucosum ATCC BAA-1512]|uniref:Nickel import system ATP-binding protein NikD n=1 Tax=Haloferax mucosum ATCC BAA-1512 TaxID=662479 RepID=M0I414_9EURY|nr:ABC transporter ATP-binding protein [Haloferax mucosum]ELZ91500.1 dipeptide/oligopeptide/nickel ABC transporter ATP-binding protein [Haloferax mucosum ATCC BAA-1512]